ncbi:serine hydrolase domain-containing protein [Chloroflexota bacterium]
MKRLAFILMSLFVLCAILTLSCVPTQRTQIPQQKGDGWQTASLDEVGLDEEVIGEAVDLINDGTYPNVHSILIVKDGKLVFEEYFSGYTWDYNDPQFRGELTDYGIDTIHNLASVTKSVTSVVFGIAIEQGYIQDVDQKVFSYFPEYASLSDEGKDEMTLAHLLTMSSGLEWNEMALPYSDSENDLVKLFNVPNPIAYILAKPLVHEPGTSWYYNGGNTNLLGEVIRETTGMRMDDFAEKYLFGPLGITDYAWDFINPDMIHASGNLKLRPRDMAKLGQLFLNKGTWKGQRIVSEEWIDQSTTGTLPPTWFDGYGYQWWLMIYRSGSTTIGSYFAAGWGGQRIVVFPRLDMVVVFTGGNYVEEEPVDVIIEGHILPAVR